MCVKLQMNINEVALDYRKLTSTIWISWVRTLLFVSKHASKIVFVEFEYRRKTFVYKTSYQVIICDFVSGKLLDDLACRNFS